MLPLHIGRYVLWHELAAGGMASVYLGRMHGPAGFGKTVAIKRMHSHIAKDDDFLAMFLDEARITSGLAHPNIVLTLDVIEQPGELFLVMEYIHGGSLAALQRPFLKAKEAMPANIACAIVAGALHGLHAAHETRGDDGIPLSLVHRDVSPQNIIVSVEGISKIGDFGIAKAVGQVHSTSEGVTKGKQSYMAPEQARGEALSVRTDVFAAGIVLWEVLTGKRLVNGSSVAERVHNLLHLNPMPPSHVRGSVPPVLDAIVLRALHPDPAQRFPTARAMASAIEESIQLAPQAAIGDWVRATIPNDLGTREAILAEMQLSSRRVLAQTPTSPQSVPVMPISAPAPASVPVPVPPPSFTSAPTMPLVQPEDRKSVG